MDPVVILEPALDSRRTGAGIREQVDPDTITLGGFDERFRDAVALEALDWREASREIKCLAVSTALAAAWIEPLSASHCTGSRGRDVSNLASTHWMIRSRIILPEMPAVVTTQPMALRLLAMAPRGARCRSQKRLFGKRLTILSAARIASLTLPTTPEPIMSS
jgi:hypothetical protein